MASAGEITVHVADLPQVQALLDDLERRVTAAEAVVEAARAWRAARPGPWVAGSDVEYRLFAAVDALDGAS